ncbi:MAG: T9SS type A sorting domain-containing protein [candidate division WOR-3 bacterium]|nr:T9SS type A sorting domain-containing protein [candidate division WOR-3 bacterium]
MLNTLLVVILVAASPQTSSFPSFNGNVTSFDFGGGGPDTFGYTWLDSDTTAPGAPVYNWISISGTGTPVTGLADDNVVGPFPIGFEFPYYWYTVNSFYLGSNGYISFGDNFNASSPFHRVPSPDRPNNVLAPLMSDLDFSVGNATCWYWTNGANDTLIIEYDSVRFWTRPNGTGNNTFQIILSRPDSTITFQYKEQEGAPYNGWTDSTNSIGIENVTGQIGLNYLFMGFPSYNMPHDSLVIRFTPPESSAYQVHDVGIYSALSENSAGIFMYNGDNLTPWSKVKNFGNQTEANFPVCGWIKNQSGQTIYADTLQAGTLLPGEIDSMIFSPDWVASTNGQFTFTAKTSLTGDMFPGNDQSIVEMRVVTYPAELQYDNGIAHRQYYWNGPGGYGNRFVPPQYPCRVTGMKVYASATPATDIFVGVLDDNGPGGIPGDTLTSATLNVFTANWYTVNFTTPAVINDGAFFIGAISSIAARPSFGMDTLLPFSRQGWEYTTGWAPSRHASIHDVCIRAMVQTVGIEEELTPAGPIPQTIVAPNPFRTQTLIKFANPQKKTVTLNIYNATGSRVKTLTAKNEEIIWHGRDDAGKKLADGIYFLKIEGGKENIEKLIIAH